MATEIIPQTEKRCTKCGEVKPLTEFYRNPECRHGIAARCKRCASAATCASALKRRANGWRPQRHDCLSHSPEYAAWYNARKRCHDPSDPSFHKYGARGVTMCDEWRKDVHAFLGHIGPRPSPEYSIDRIDGTKGYEPGNVRWATDTEQSQNLSSNRWVTAFGETLVLREWVRRSGVPYATLHQRLAEGWDTEQAISTPPSSRGCRNRPRLITFNGRTMRLREWSKEVGIAPSVLHTRIKNWGVERALTTPLGPNYRKRAIQDSPLC